MLNLFNLLKRPIETETLDAWAKILEDIAKVALLALPVVIFGQNHFLFKLASSFALLLIAYLALIGGKQIRKHKPYLSKED
ncbi:hypothetical protein [Avibacterium paragallinarum]|uniref:Uncharacterized protein n=1 Tax=Avibacterium paragallinarum TaxID=728 RepID=A0A0F5EUF5_AVIPA|nr:hypothetical protein [Avibacterium paragallinarum]KAA6207995.1 hypothetical protein F1968_11730 [Avibacterium paragallinarum]KKB00223.1 hypothetical protein Z012_11655 [Avibacterium paragallinarum]RZN53068.1 hypothetical protein EIG78_12565 [Avibacterium paragallinarum]RZN68598.1 hypothetical protein EIG77_10995 [Avibacterium paragallinarum]TID28827.1 hypothetical protein JO83_01940 [Avibacterium paragallinarum]